MAAFHPRTRLDSYVEGVLTPASRARVTAHLADCADCRREVEQRRRILRAAASLGSARPASAPSRAPSYPDRAADPGAAPLLERREGVAGWKVVLGLGAVCLVASGVLTTAWVAGDPDAAQYGAGQSRLLPVTGASPSPHRDDAGRSSEGASPAPASSGASEGPTAADAGPTGPSDPAVLSPAGAALPSIAGRESSGPAGPAATPAPAPSAAESGHGVALAGTVDLTPALVTELRQSGWNVPTLHGLGLRSESTDWRHGEGSAEVVMALAGEDQSLELHECRSLQEGTPAPSCPVDWAAGAPPTIAPSAGSLAVPEDAADAAPGAGSAVLPDAGAAARAVASVVTEPLARVGAQVIELPVGGEMTVREHADGSWTAHLTTAQAAYAVESDLPVESASRVMSMVVISERSRVQGGAAPDSPADRLARGFERLMPWTGTTPEGPR